jgi:hypothetical protein
VLPGIPRKSGFPITPLFNKKQMVKKVGAKIGKNMKRELEIRN